ncbi:DNA repair exonuclease [Stieleria sp. TO1_6]|uniref:metallophosphoesterase family protein n=1 Tax=Stieleria tagensis TaxID=2956795 RepID=UPI00209B6E5B|nr:DNA repair exonuclease [Stieleria tagensis]MCO8123978.1 DNA repair exonuclease [Stieleria tagensis]
MAIRKVLHAADIHLDSPLQKLDQYDNAPAQKIRGATRRALENMTLLAIDQQVDLVVIAGDLYDGDWTDQNTGLAFVAEAARLVQAGIPLLVIRGNHDAANQMTSSLPLPKNPDGSEIFLATGKPESRFLEDLGIAVHGQSFRTRAERGNLAAKYPDSAAGMFNIGLLHTGLEGETSHAHYAPCSPAQLTDKHYDYWALGHIHSRRDHAIPGGPPIVFSGNLQGRHIREQGPKGCVIIEIDEKNQCQYAFHPLDVIRWHQCLLDVSEMAHRDEISDAYQQWLADTIETSDDRLVVARVRLVGRSKLHAALHRHEMAIRSDLQAISVASGADLAWLEDIKIRTSMPKARSTPLNLDGPLESLNQVLAELRDDEALAKILESELSGLQKKLPKELKSDDQTAFPFSDPEWINGLIESAAADVFGRLQEDEFDDESTEALR